MPEYRNPFQEILSGLPAVATYDEVVEWWEGGDWNMSDYPPSAWHDYAEKEGLSIEDLTANPAQHEAGVEELHSAGDGRTCECEWAEHETNCKEG